MFDRKLAIEILERIEESICEVQDWTQHIVSADDFYTSTQGMILLNAVCMKLLSIGEEVKNLDRRTASQLLNRYPSIPWKEVMGLRDIIAHHYFEVDAGQIFTVLHIDIPPLLEVIKKMKKEI